MEICSEDCRCPPSVASSLDAPRFLLTAKHEGHNISELPRIDPDTQARIEALLEAAGNERRTCRSFALINSNKLVFCL